MSQYCVPADLVLYVLPPAAVVAIPNPTQVAQCIAASEKADSYMRGRFQLPLLAWGTDVTMHTAYIAAFLLMSQRGFNPVAGSDSLIKDRYYEAIGYPGRPGTGWFPGIERQSVHPDVTPSPSPGTNYQLPQVSSSPPRGWNQLNSRGRPSVG